MADVLSRAGDLSSLAGPGTEMVAALAAHDEANESEYLATVRTYLECLCNRERTARRLNVHANTVSFRVKRAEQIMGASISNPTQLKNLVFGLMIHDAQS